MQVHIYLYIYTHIHIFQLCICSQTDLHSCKCGYICTYVLTYPYTHAYTLYIISAYGTYTFLTCMCTAPPSLYTVWGLGEVIHMHVRHTYICTTPQVSIHVCTYNLHIYLYIFIFFYININL